MLELKSYVNFIQEVIPIFLGNHSFLSHLDADILINFSVLRFVDNTLLFEADFLEELKIVFD